MIARNAYTNRRQIFGTRRWPGSRLGIKHRPFTLATAMTVDHNNVPFTCPNGGGVLLPCSSIQFAWRFADSTTCRYYIIYVLGVSADETQARLDRNIMLGMVRNSATGLWGGRYYNYVVRPKNIWICYS